MIKINLTLKIIVLFLLTSILLLSLPLISYAKSVTVSTSDTILQEGIYQLRNLSTGKCMQIQGTSNGSRVIQNTKSNSDSQKFIVRSSGTGTSQYYILPISSLGISLDINSGSGNNIQLEVFKHLYYTPLNYKNQTFVIDKIDSKTYYSIKTKCGTNQCITVQTSTNAVMQNTFSNVQINYWYFDKVGNVSSDLSEGVYQIKNSNTNKYIEVQNGDTTNSTKLI